MLQMMLMGGTILGPGTIFLMLVGAFVAAFRIDNWTSFEYNLYPIMLFMFVCFTMKSEYQVSMKIVFYSFVFDIIKELNIILCDMVFVTVIGRANIINGLCYDNDGCNCGYSTAIRRGRYRIPIRYILDFTVKFFLYSGLFTSPGVLVYRSRYHLSIIYTLYVLAFDFVFYYKSECSIVGYARSANQENKEGGLYLALF